jgi:hypothetical protein
LQIREGLVPWGVPFLYVVEVVVMMTMVLGTAKPELELYTGNPNDHTAGS